MSDNKAQEYIERLKLWINKPIFKMAFIHRSYLNEAKPPVGSHSEVDEGLVSNERLEFLGDSILSFITSVYLYNKRPKDSEGDLTNLRSYIVKTQSLAKASKMLNLGEMLMMSKGEEISGGRENPQLLANTFEALIGAVYLDSGVEEARKFIEGILIPIFEREIEMGPPKDAKSQLQELTQNLTKQSPKYKILETSGPDHSKEFRVGVFLQDKKLGEGMGLSKQVAEEEAASKALVTLSKEIP